MTEKQKAKEAEARARSLLTLPPRVLQARILDVAIEGDDRRFLDLTHPVAQQRVWQILSQMVVVIGQRGLDEDDTEALRMLVQLREHLAAAVPALATLEVSIPKKPDITKDLRSRTERKKADERVDPSAMLAGDYQRFLIAAVRHRISRQLSRLAAPDLIERTVAVADQIIAELDERDRLSQFDQSVRDRLKIYRVDLTLARTGRQVEW